MQTITRITFHGLTNVVSKAITTTTMEESDYYKSKEEEEMSTMKLHKEEEEHEHFEEVDISNDNNNNNSFYYSDKQTLIHSSQQHFDLDPIIIMNDNMDNANNINKKTNFINKIIQLCTYNYSLWLSHVLLITNLLLFSGFILLTPKPMKILNPLVFAFFRILFTFIPLVPITMVIDRNFYFRSESEIEREKLKYLKKRSNFKLIKKLQDIYIYFLFENKLIIYIKRKLPKRKDFIRLCLCGITVTFNQLFFTLGFFLCNATISGIMQPLTAIIVCTLSMMLKVEQRSILKFIGVIISVIGAIAMLLISAFTKSGTVHNLMNDKEQVDVFIRSLLWLNNIISKNSGVDNNSTLDTILFIFGLICLIINTTSYSCYLILQKKLLQKGVPPITVTCWSFFVGLFIAFIGASYYFPNFNYRKIDNSIVLAILYAGVINGAFTFIFNTYAGKLSTPTVLGIYSTLSPLFSMLTGMIALGEQVSPLVFIGAILILFGVAVVIFARWKESKQQQLVSLEEAHHLEECNDKNVVMMMEDNDDEIIIEDVKTIVDSQSTETSPTTTLSVETIETIELESTNVTITPTTTTSSSFSSQLFSLPQQQEQVEIYNNNINSTETIR
ncbi:hypothetical protein ABK040_006588 [Willaertia magna]